MKESITKPLDISNILAGESSIPSAALTISEDIFRALQDLQTFRELGSSDKMPMPSFSVRQAKSPVGDSFAVFPTLPGGGNMFSKKEKASPPITDGESSGQSPPCSQPAASPRVVSEASKASSSSQDSEQAPAQGKSGDEVDFKDWPAETYVETPVNGLHVGLLLQSQANKGDQNHYWKKRALRMIRLFMLEKSASDDHLHEIVPLSKAANAEISEKLLTAIGSKLEKGMENPSRLLIALNEVLSNTLKENFNTTLLGNVLDLLVDKIGNVFASEDELTNLMTESLVSILNCLYISGVTGIPQEKYKAYKDSFGESWIDKVREKPDALQAKRALFVELLKRIGDGQDKVAKYAKITGKVTLGLFNAVTAAVSFDISSAISALGDISEVLGEVEWNKKWFDVYTTFRLSLAESVQKANEFLESLTAKTFNKIHVAAAFLIVDAIKDCFRVTREGARREQIFGFFLKLAAYSNLPKDPELIKHMQVTRKEMQDCQPPIISIKTELFEKAGYETSTVREMLLSIQEATTKNEEFNGRFANYIPCQAERAVNKGQHHDAMKLIKDFLSPNNKRKVLLILGDSGSGKSLLQQYTVRELWKEFELDQGNSIPFYVPLTALENPRKSAIYELLSASTKNSMEVQGLEFSEEQIKLMKKERSFIFFLDAFDEIEFSSTSIYQSNNLAEWPNAKVVIGCRKQFLNNISGYHELFAPLKYDGSPEPIDEIHILPFTKEQRVQYFEKYVELHPESKWKEGIIFEKQLQFIPSLKDLAVTPFMIYLAATTLPDIYDQRSEHSRDKEQIKMMRTEFYRQFVSSWFMREKGKFKSFLPTGFPKDFPKYLNHYCLNLAKIMLSRNENALRYEWDEFENKSNDNDLDRFFGNIPEWLDIIRRAAPIKKTSATTYEFIHKSVYEFFAGDAIFNQFTFQEDDIQELPQSTLTAETTTSTSDQSSEKPAQAAVTKEPSRNRLANVALQVLKGRKDSQGPVNALNRPIEYAIVLNLSERVHKDDSYKNQLFEIIHLSKSDETKAQAAANAITILNYAGVSFTNMNFSGVRIPGADLSRSILDGTNFIGANLNNVSFVDACLGSCIFNEASMDGVKFGRHPLLLGHTDYVRSVCSVNGPNGECWLASGSNDRTIHIWDIASGSEIKTLNGHTRTVNSVCSVNGPNGECWLASGSDDKTIRIWDIATGSDIKALNGHTDYVNSVCSVNGPNGECWLASGSHDNTIRIWDIASGSEIKTLNGHTSAVTSVCSVNGPNGECWLASGSYDNTIRIWDIATGSEIKTLNGHTSAITSVCSVNGPNGECWSASGSVDNTIRIWDIATGLEIKTLNGHTRTVNSVCSVKGPNGECWLASGSWDNTIRFWDIATGSEIKTLNGHTSYVFSVCSVNGPNGECWLASGSHDRTIRIWDIATGSEIKTLNGHTHPVSSVCSVNGPNGECWLASGSYDKTIRIWDIATGSEVKTLNGHTSIVSSVCSVNGPNGECWLASGSVDNTIRIWDIATGSEVKTLNGHTSYVFSVCSVNGPNGECWLASGSGDETIRIWDIATGSEIKTLNGHTGYVYSVCSVNEPNGECWLASGSGDYTIRIWNIASGSEIKTLNGHTSFVRSVCTVNGPNGECWLASGSDDKTIRVWDIASGSEIHKVDKSEATYTKDAQLVRKDEPGVILAQFQSIGAAMQMVNTEKIMDVRTKHIIGPRRLEGGDMQLRNVVGLSKLNKKLLLQEGGVSFDKEFTTYCELGRFTKFQARMMAKCYGEGWGVEKDLQKSIEWLGKALDFESLKQHTQNGSEEAFDVLLKLAEEMDDDEEIKHPQAAKIVAECYAEGWGVEKDAQNAGEWLGKSS